jgi:two-component sensor histidine kinase
MTHAIQNEVVLLSRGTDESATLDLVIRRLATAECLEQVTGVLTYAVRALLGADGATVVLRDGDRCHYVDEDAVSPLWKGRRFPLRACISGWCMLHEQPVVVPDIYLDPRVPVDAYRPTFVRSLAMAPIGAGPAFAALGAYWAAANRPSLADVERLQVIAGAAALALARFHPRGKTGAHTSKTCGAPTAAAALGPRARLRSFFERLRSRGLRRTSAEPYLFAFGCVTLATAMRELAKATGAAGIATFATFYPAVLLSMVVGGRRAGATATLLGGLAAYYFFMPPLYRFAPPSGSEVVNLTLYGVSCALIILIIDWYKRATQRLREEDAHHLTLAREQAHRVQNAVGVIEAVVRQSLRRDPGEARLINKRLRAALATVDIRPRTDAEPKDLRALLDDELQPFDLARFDLDGPASRLAPEVAGVLILAVHELATNAVKHGALSADGRVAIAWSVAEGPLKLSWREQGGPPVAPPRTRGYGGLLLRRLVEAQKGKLALDFDPAGLRAELILPLQPVRR